MNTKKIIAMLIVCLCVSTAASTFAAEKEKRDVSYPFSKVLVDNGINLYFSQGDNTSTSIEAETDVADKIETVVQDETLIIRVKKGEKLKRNTIVNAHITAAAVSEIKADRKSSVYLQTPIYSDGNMSIHIANGSTLNSGAINAKEVNISANNGSNGKLGKIVASTFTLNVLGGAEVSGGDVNTDFASVSLFTKSTASVSINATNLVSQACNASDLTIGGMTNNITANASGGSYIRGNNLHFEKSTTKSLSGSSVKLAQK